MKNYLPTLLLLVLCAIMPEASLTRGDTLSAFMFHFTHASIWHLLANFYVIIYFRPRWENLPVAYVSATLAALLPFVPTDAPTVGISGLIFAMLARRDAICRIWNWKLLGLNFILAFVPCYNWKIHFFSYIIAFIIWKTYLNSRSRRR